MRDSSHSLAYKSRGTVVKASTLAVMEDRRGKGRLVSTNVREPLIVLVLISGVTILRSPLPGSTKEANSSYVFFINSLINNCT